MCEVAVPVLTGFGISELRSFRSLGTNLDIDFRIVYLSKNSFMCAFSSYPVPLVELLEGQVPVPVPVIFRLSDPEFPTYDPELPAISVTHRSRLAHL